MRKSLAVLILLGVMSPCLDAQILTSQAMATVHLFRTGSRGNAIQVLIDDAEILKLSDHDLASLTLLPGRYEIGAEYGRQQPVLDMTLQAGHEYFVELTMEARHSALFTGAAEGAIALTQQRNAPAGLHDIQLSHDDLDTILSQTIYGRHPQGEAPEVSVKDSPTPAAPARVAPIASPTPPPSATVPAIAGPASIAEQSYRVKYAGGTIAGATVGRELQLRISPAAVALGNMRIPTGAVTTIALSQDKHHRIGTGIAISMVTLGAGVPVMFSKSTKDFIELTWNNAGQTGGAAFQADKNEYRGILAALEGVTGKTATLPAEK